ncbi:hypothetical protein HYALB_00000947 [Hymenoscyphus albidus]|uniref:Nitronate monooxygenase domain-containing protein n=1 Tax=Hymenoscyphus albidus TaxID=595503 RepID=A0A9N9Q2F9_9HELO|nr:hypothetical protein HYALB_00000947 [Hymenoscyphus albidus]
MATPHIKSLESDYPWITPSIPLITSAPMRLISTAPLAIAVSRAVGLGFLGSGTDVSTLPDLLSECTASFSSSPIPNTPPEILPIGVGFICWGASLSDAIKAIAESRLKPAAVWLFAPERIENLVTWTTSIREATNNLTKIWIQIGTVNDTNYLAQHCKPDVFVIQGSDAGGHGLNQSSSIITLLPECSDALSQSGFAHIPLIAAGGIMDARGAAAAIMLGASGICMGTRFLASFEAELSKGYQDAVLSASDGGVTTNRTSVYDRIRGTPGWPSSYGGRGVLNDTFWDSEKGLDDEQNKRLYAEASQKGDLGWGIKGIGGRMCTYAGTGVGLVREVKGAEEIVKEVREGMRKLLKIE